MQHAEPIGLDGAEGLEVPSIRIPEGHWQPPEGKAARSFAYLLTRGMLLRRVSVRGGTSIELLSCGDCVLPWRDEAASFSQAEWEAIHSTRLAVLDLRPGSPLSRFPSVAARIVAAAVDRSRRLAVQSAIMSIVGVEDRLRALLWSLAERWGSSGPEGVVLDLDLPQSVLAEMVGARRPSVSTALGGLADRGLLRSRGDGRWLLLGSPPPVDAAPSDP
jgi:hypothetical protein